MRSRNKLTQLLALFLALLTVVSVCPLSVSAESGFYEEGDANYDNTGGTSSDKSGEFNLSYTDNVAKQIVGYRITGIKANGEKQSPDSTDVYIKNAQYIKDMGQSAFKTKFEGSGIYVSMNQYCKREFYLAESSNSALADGTITAKSNYVYEWNYSLSGEIPTTEAEFDTWQQRGNNDNQLAKWAGYSSKAAMKNGDKIIVEPIYYLNRVWSATCFLTVSEIANFGQSKYGGTSEGWINTGANEANKENNTTSGATTFGYIANFTNRKWPNAFYTKDGMGLWEGATAVGSSSRVTFNNMLLKGYGVIILYDEPTLPDLYVESIKFYTSDGVEQNKAALPINKTIYVFATYKATTNGTVKANFFGYQNASDRTGRTFSASDMNVVTSMSISTSGPYYGSKYSTSRQKYSKTTKNSRYEAGMADGSSFVVCIGTMSSTSADACGYYHAAIYLNDKTSASLDDETNTTNNYKCVPYEFAGKITHDLELSKITLKVNGKTLTGSELTSIPFGAKVEVYHTYKSNSEADGVTVSEPYCVTLSGNSSNPKGMVLCSIGGSFVHDASSYSITKKVTDFYATSLISANRYGGIYLQTDYNYDAAEETNSDNNKKYVTWKAVCDIQVYQIILKDAAGNTLGTYTRGGTNSAPTLKQGQQVYVYYKYKNTSAEDIVANGHRSKSATSSNLTVSKVTIPANGTVTKYSHFFTVGSEQSGKVSGAVYVDKNKYGISSSSVTYTGCETNSTNNTLEMTYYVEDLIDLEIVKIQYVYIDDDGENVTLTVNRGSTNAVRIPYGKRVYVWYTYKNNSDKTVKIDGYYSEGSVGTPGTLINGSVGNDNANGKSIAAGGTFLVYSNSFVATTMGEGYYYGAVFQDGKTSATGESNTTNNTMTAKYRVWGYDVSIDDIFYKDEDGNVYGKGTDSVELTLGKTYDIYYTVKNNGSETLRAHIYDNVDPTASGALKVTPYTDGVFLAPNQSSDLYAGKFLPDAQVLGVNSVDGSVFIGNSKTVRFTYAGYTGVETNTTNNTRVETVTLKFDVAITDIYYTTTNGTKFEPDADGVVNIPANVSLIRYYVLKNNTAAPIDVNIYYEADGVIDPIFDGPSKRVITLAAGEEKTVETGRTGFTISSSSDAITKTVKGRVYRDGQEIEADPYEITFDNNVYEVTIEVYKTPYLTAIAPNAKYREGTTVITSFYLHNPTSVNYTGTNLNNSLQVAIAVTDPHGNVIHSDVTTAIIPANKEGNAKAQLVFFKWDMPDDYGYSYVSVNAQLYVPQLDMVTSSVTDNRYTCSGDVVNTPDTQYEARPPANWQSLVNANAPASKNGQTAWAIWSYNSATKKWSQNWFVYYVEAGSASLSPVSRTSYQEGAQYYMKSGYGVYLWCNKANARFVVGLAESTSDMYTGIQYAYATWQEYGYSKAEGCITTMESFAGGNLWQLPTYSGYGRKIHFSPIWYPNRGYSAYVCYSDIWTPMGMITVAGKTNTIEVRQNMYDDWYIGHG